VWRRHVDELHAERAGITEDLLSQAVDEHGRTPYGWLADAVPPGLRVLDLACGSAPTGPLLRAATYVGIDRSRNELMLARRRSRPVAQADTTRLPLRDASVDAVAVSMALQLVPLSETLREVRRVLTGDGLLVATVPVAGPLRRGDALRYARLCLALRVRGISYPNDEALADVENQLRAAGLTLVSDESSAFGYPLPSPAAAEQLLDSLYLPDVPPTRLAAGRQVVRRWVGSRIGVPVRRIAARAVSAGEPAQQ
jgi:SAM-dependent methyltransferase